MKTFDLKTPITNLDGTSIEVGANPCPRCGRPFEPQELTLGLVCTEALGGAYPDEQPGQRGAISDTERLERYRLAMRLINEKQVNLTSAEITKVLGLIPRRWPSPVIYGRVHDLLEGIDGDTDIPS